MKISIAQALSLLCIRLPSQLSQSPKNELNQFIFNQNWFSIHSRFRLSFYRFRLCKLFRLYDWLLPNSKILVISDCRTIEFGYDALAAFCKGHLTVSGYSTYRIRLAWFNIFIRQHVGIDRYCTKLLLSPLSLSIRLPLQLSQSPKNELNIKFNFNQNRFRSITESAYVA